MPNDQFGKPISVGDTVVIKGQVTKVLDDPDYVNCTVKMTQQMPPAGTEINLQLNTQQLEKTGGSKSTESKGAEPKVGQPTASGAQPPQHEQAQQPHGGAKK